MTGDRSPITRRRALAVGAGAIAGAFALPRRWFGSPPRHATTIPDGAWPMRRRDPARTGHAPNQSGPTADPTVRWTADLSDDASTRSRVVASTGTVYAATDRSIHAFDAATGERRWRTTDFGILPGSDGGVWVETGPVLDGSRLFAGSSVSQYALDRADGRARWQYRTNSSLHSTLRAGSTVFVSSSVGAGDRLVALDARSGTERWRTAPDAGVRASAAANGRVVGPTIERGAAFGAVDAATGGTEWTRDLRFDSGLRGGACIADGTVYVGSGPLYALDLADGATRWSTSLGAHGAGVAPVSDGERVYLVLGDAGRALALDATTGDAAWSADLSGVVDESAPALADGTLYVGLERGVAALDASSGEEQFRVRKPGTANVGSSPVLAGGTLYVILDGVVYALGGPGDA